MPTSPRSMLAAFALALVLFFLWVNRPAYRGFFTDDDLDNLANARGVQLVDFPRALVQPSTGGAGNFRAAAYFYYFAMSRAVGNRYVPYVAGIQAIHLVNVLLVFLLARALGAQMTGACGAALAFVFHAAALDVYWKAMYVFDLLCATFTLSCVLAYVRGRTVLSVVCFWLALKSKEVPILLPVVLAAYELWLGGRKWKRLAPFFAISALFGGAALFSNTHRESDYTLRFSGAALWECARYYARQLAFVPYAGFAVLAAPFLAPRNARLRLGVLMFVLLSGPMLVLPGRLFAAYLYVPLIGLAVALSSLTAPLAVALFCLCWIPLNYWQVKPYRNRNLDASAERRDWFQSLSEFVPRHPEIENYIYDGAPESLASWGVAGGVRVLRAPESITRVAPLDSAEGKKFLRDPSFALLVWDAPVRKVRSLMKPPGVDASYVTLDASAPFWQLKEGWAGNQGVVRWMAPVAKASLYRPGSASALEVVVNVSEYYIAQLHESRFEVLLNGASLGVATLRVAKPVTLRFPIPAGPAGPVEVEFRVSPPLPDPNHGAALGQPIASFGFR